METIFMAQLIWVIQEWYSERNSFKYLACATIKDKPIKNPDRQLNSNLTFGKQSLYAHDTIELN